MKTRVILILIFGLSMASGSDLERGKAIYSQLCFNCHGPNLDGGIGPALKDQYWRHGSSPKAILDVINKGVPGTEMIAYEAIFPEADRIALRDYIVSEQEGMREMMRAVYPREYFKGKRLTPELFDSVESLSQTLLPENHYYFERNGNGILRGTSKLYIKEAGDYRFSIRKGGRTSIYLDGEEVHYSDDKTDKSTHINQTFKLEPGTYAVEVLHEEKTTHSYRFYGALEKVGGKRFVLTGRSLEGNTPKIIKARPGMAQVVRKWINGMPPRALLCLLPNQVIVAFNPVDGRIVKAWHSAEINQTPSLPDRSAKPSEMKGEEIADSGQDLIETDNLRFLNYSTEGESVLIGFQIDGEEKTVKISPVGTQSFSISLK